jgi:hypothetical protein
VIRDLFLDDAGGHRRLAFWERFAVRIGFSRAAEGLHFPEAGALREALRGAGFARVDEVAGAGRGTNRMWVAWREPERSAAESRGHADQTE